ncbi:hypothetical protein B0H10DRAFT_2330487 [Mycena sp. CBHHK59/15]|nr:hypothetical protein B0H10DRAFT_2330487 [Mycena sp. CBHHK59/15]
MDPPFSFGKSFCTPVASGGTCTSNCGALAECGPDAAPENITCPLNVSLGFAEQPKNSANLLDANPTIIPPVHSPAEPINRARSTDESVIMRAGLRRDHIIEMSPGDAALWTRTTALKQKNIALKVFLSIGGWSSNDPVPCPSFPASGDVDWEYPAAYDRGGAPEDKANYVTFMTKVKAAFKPRGYGLTFTAPSSFWYLQHFGLPGLMAVVDWVNLMSYDLHGTWDGTDPYIGPLVLAHTNLTEITASARTRADPARVRGDGAASDASLDLFNNVGVDPSQIVLGIGFYGRSFQLADPDCVSPAFIQGSEDNGSCENENADPNVINKQPCPTICSTNNKPVCCEASGESISGETYLSPATKMFVAFLNALGSETSPTASTPHAKSGKSVFSVIYRATPLSRVWEMAVVFTVVILLPFLSVPESWVLPSLDPTPGGHQVIQPATFTVDFDDDIGTSDPNQTGSGSSGESDDGKENDSPVLAYCSKSIDSDDSGCGHVFIGQAAHTIVRLPTTCGAGPYARVVSLDIHINQSVLPATHQALLPVNELVYSLKFDYNFAAIPAENGPILMRADVTDMPGYWDAMINSPPDNGTTSTKRSSRSKRDFHQPEGLDRRWFVYHFPPGGAIQQCYVYLSAGASAQATFTITGLAEAHFGTERAEIISFGFPGLYYPAQLNDRGEGLLTLGPSLHLYGELTGQLRMSGSYSTSVGYEFPPIDLSFGKQDKNSDEENTGSAVDPDANNNGFDYSFGYNVNLEGKVEVPSLQLGLSVLGGAVLDAQIFTEADIYAGVGITGSVSSAVAPKFCVNPDPNSGVDAPNRNLVNVVNLYDNWIYQVVANVSPFIRDQVQFSRDGNTEQVSTPASVYEAGVQVTQADLTNQIYNQPTIFRTTLKRLTLLDIWCSDRQITKVATLRRNTERIGPSSMSLKEIKPIDVLNLFATGRLLDFNNGGHMSLRNTPKYVPTLGSTIRPRKRHDERAAARRTPSTSVAPFRATAATVTKRNPAHCAGKALQWEPTGTSSSIGHQKVWPWDLLAMLLRQCGLGTPVRLDGRVHANPAVHRVLPNARDPPSARTVHFPPCICVRGLAQARVTSDVLTSNTSSLPRSLSLVVWSQQRPQAYTFALQLVWHRYNSFLPKLARLQVEPADLAALCRISRLFRDEAQRILYRNADLRVYRMRYVKSWCLSVTINAHLAERVHALALQLAYNLDSSDVAKISRALEACVNLKELTIFNDFETNPDFSTHLWMIDRWPFRLTKFTNSYSDIYRMESFLKTQSDIRVLSLPTSYSLHDIPFTNIVALEVPLHILSFAGLSFAGPKIKQLRRIQTSCRVSYDYSCLERVSLLGQQCQDLTTFNLLIWTTPVKPDWTADFVEEVAKALPGLIHFGIKETEIHPPASRLNVVQRMVGASPDEQYDLATTADLDKFASAMMQACPTLRQVAVATEDLGDQETTCTVTRASGQDVQSKHTDTFDFDAVPRFWNP